MNRPLSLPPALTTSLVAAVLVAITPSRATPALPPAATSSQQHLTLRLIAINDLHGNLEEGTLSLNWPNPTTPGATTKLPAGGAPALAGLIASLRQGATHSLVLSSGDLIGATPLISALFHDEPTIAIANHLGVDLAIPGNHEFDAGQAELLRLLNGGPHPPARFATIAANITTASGATLFPATTIRSVGGVKVGFIGAVTRTTPQIVIASGIAGLRFGEEAEAINQAAAALQRQGVEAIVAVIHEGGETGAPGAPLDWNNSSCPNARGPIFGIARQLAPAIDVVFSAHSHQGYNCWIDGRPILQATAFGRGVSVVDLALNPRTGDVDRARTSSRNLPVLNGRTDPEQRKDVLYGTCGSTAGRFDRAKRCGWW
ncbi:MAG: metallophosphoesterase [Cyanobium sp.]